MERKKLDLERAKMEARFINTLAYRMDQENGHPQIDFLQVDIGPIQTEIEPRIHQLMASIDEAAQVTHDIGASIKRKRDTSEESQFLKSSEITRKKWCRAEYNDVRTARAALEASNMTQEQTQTAADPWSTPEQQPIEAVYLASATTSSSQGGASSNAWV